MLSLKRSIRITIAVKMIAGIKRVVNKERERVGERVGLRK